MLGPHCRKSIASLRTNLAEALFLQVGVGLPPPEWWTQFVYNRTFIPKEFILIRLFILITTKIVSFGCCHRFELKKDDNTVDGSEKFVTTTWDSEKNL